MPSVTVQVGKHNYTTHHILGKGPGMVPITEVTSVLGSQVIATLTRGARTVALRKEPRAYTESYTTSACGTGQVSFSSNAWVRLLPEPFNGTIDQALDSWVTQALQSDDDDVLAVARSYINGAASYGPPDEPPDDYCGVPLGKEGADYHDFLGIDVKYQAPDYTTDLHDPDAQKCVDCSGFVRLVYGHHMHVPMSLGPACGKTLPRKSVHMYSAGPGVLMADTTILETQLIYFSKILPGDLVFFKADEKDLALIDHVGIYIDHVHVNKNGERLTQHRFISSRRKANGPTFADTAAMSILNGDSSNYYPAAFRAIRRI